MATLATELRWTDSAPKICFDISYEKSRTGSTQYYQVKVSCRPLYSSTSKFGYPIYVSISLDGVNKTSYTLKSASPSQWSSAISNTTGWLAVNNKTSGKTALAVRIYSGSGSSRDVTYKYNLDIDPVASTISCTTTEIESNPTITISKAASNFTHTVRYSFGSLTGTIAEKTTATIITNWTIPADFYSQIPNDPTGEGTLTCITYNGNTQVGSSTCPLSVTTNYGKCKPLVWGTVKDTNLKTIALTGNDNILVRYASNALCTFTTATARNGSTLRQTNINLWVGTSKTYKAVEIDKFEFRAEDSRGYFGFYRVTKDLVPYVKPTANVTAQRTDPTSGRATLTIEGAYFNGNFGVSQNTLTVKYRQKNGAYTTVQPTITNNTYKVTVSLTGVDYTQAIDYEVVVEDKVSAVTKTATIRKGIPVFDWGENDFNFNVPVTIQGVNILEKLAELEALVKG
jgi:hypothetical protein